jgi:hypothetical protein
MTCLLLFYEFFKTGLFAVGGGLATLPFLYDMAARHPEWFTVSQLADMLADSDVGASKGGLFDDSKTLSKLIGRPTTTLAESVSHLFNVNN